MSTRNTLGFGLVAGLLGLALAAPLQAQGIAPVDRGWYSGNGDHNTANYGYFVGQCETCAFSNYRNWFVFDLGCVTDIITAASLVLEMPDNGYGSVHASETYALFDVSTPLADLMGGVGGSGAYGDLGTGTSYGSATVSSADNGQEIVVPLNTAGLAALNAAIGGQVGIGGAITTLDLIPGTRETIFGGSSDWAVRLVMETSCNVRDADDRGWYDDSGFHNPTSPNYIVGNCTTCTDDYYRNWFVFDLSDVTDVITGATLALEHPYSHGSLDPSETFELFDVSTPIAALTAGTGGVAAYDDIGSGTSYGSYELTVADSGSLVTVSLNAAGVAALNAAVGGQVALGGAITTLDADPDTIEVSFGSNVPYHQIVQLLLETTGGDAWTNLGQGLAGTGGLVPLLGGSGELLGNDVATFILVDALPGAPAYFVLGVSLLEAPFKGGVLFPSPDIIIPNLPVSPGGGIEFGFLWPPGVPADVSLYYQYWIVDAGGVFGFAASNGLQSTTP